MSGQDLLSNRYSRLRELPLALARRGHRVRGLCIDYHGRPREAVVDSDAGSSARVDWISIPGRFPRAYALVKMAREAAALHAREPFDVVLSTSDCPYVVLGEYLAGRFGCLPVADLYDNYESFASARIPGMKSLYWRALRRTGVISTVSDTLAEYVRVRAKPGAKVIPVYTGIPAGLFVPMEGGLARSKFGLSSESLLVGMAGAIESARGVDLLFQAVAKLREEFPTLELVLAGPVRRDITVPTVSYIKYLGLLPNERVPSFLSALDVGVIPVRDDAFGKFCFPMKLFEMAAVGLPFVAANVGELGRVLKGYSELLYRPDDLDSLERALRGQLKERTNPAVKVLSWDDVAASIDGVLG